MVILTKRAFLGGAACAALAGCGGGAGQIGAPGVGGGSTYRPTQNAGFDSWLAGFRQRAASSGISDSTISRAFRGAGYLPDVVERDRNQTEFKRSLEDYLAIAASDERVSKGRAALARHGNVLSRIESQYGVPAHVVTAVWGLESYYGERRGDVPVISALATLAYDGRRGSFFESQLIAALRILENGDITPERMTGSWAGAMGHTQFIPTSYLSYAVDFTGDGRRDIWSDDPTDALASTAAYLNRAGWVRGQPWGGEVGSAAANSGTPSEILQPQVPGPQFAVFRNFQVIKRYNNSNSYALGVGHLSDRIAGAGPLKGQFGPDANGLTLADRKRLQQRLTAAGFDTEGADGVIGPKSESAIRAYQRQNGLPETGQPSPGLLARLG
ncbi:lytic murein transglycosylase [Arenibacterium halophilum]|uniref:Lytic murein transglycosylase n=1 Tax=Arenibacterium halophilum TaxID=2583821 RepID=A0ABY2X6C1_9RHOB|nr:lytic murein transglycosylase [Arenibacterium halophilum]TMV11339.1 lytic murein transglycosylase [Arenibacterium halophilum]